MRTGLAVVVRCYSLVFREQGRGGGRGSAPSADRLNREHHISPDVFANCPWEKKPQLSQVERDLEIQTM